jgi:hypothetical protein
MGNEQASQIGRGSAAANASYAEPSDGGAVGKQSLAEGQSVAPRDELVERVKARAGTELLENPYAYVVTPEGAFRITAAPTAKSIGAVITMTGPYAKAWHTLVELLDRTGNAECIEPPKQAAVAPAAAQPTAPAAAPQPAAPAAAQPASPAQDVAPSAEQTPAQDAKQATETDGGAGTVAPATTPGTESGSVYWVSWGNATLKDERTGWPLKPPRVIPQLTHVRVLEKKSFKDFTGAKVATLDGAELGWANLLHLTPLIRPPRPSTASAQMAAVLAAARSVAGAKMKGKCFHFVKEHILNGGGYGDILDMDKDDRFVGNLELAVQFHAAVQKHGAAALGLEQVGGLPMQAAPGTLLVLRGTEKNGISPTAGDISVIEGFVNSRFYCFNDGHMELMSRESAWSGEGHMADSLVAMYRPLDRK